MGKAPPGESGGESGTGIDILIDMIKGQRSPIKGQVTLNCELHKYLVHYSSFVPGHAHQFKPDYFRKWHHGKNSLHSSHYTNNLG